MSIGIASDGLLGGANSLTIASRGLLGSASGGIISPRGGSSPQMMGGMKAVSIIELAILHTFYYK